MLSQGVPMITGGDERLRSQRCNNNPYNLDSPATWLDWTLPEPAFTTFARRMMQFCAAHAALRPATWIEPAQVSWRDAAGNLASGAYMDDATRPVLAWRLDGASLGDASPALYVAYNRGAAQVQVTLPPSPTGSWYRVADAGAWMEPQANSAAPGAEYRMNQARNDLVGARSRCSSLADVTIGFGLDEPVRLDEAADLHERARRADHTEHLAVCARRVLPGRNVDEHHARADHVLDGAAGVLDRAPHDLEAALGLTVDIAWMCGRAVGGERRGAADRNPWTDAHRTRQADRLLVLAARRDPSPHPRN
jgi:hypothetical protein